jgi:hypothetical protein
MRLLLMFVMLACAGSSAQPATGTLGYDCQSAAVLRLDGLPDNAHATLHLYKLVAHRKLPFTGRVYLVDEFKQPTREGTVAFDSINGKDAVGTYTATFPDGTTQTGRFRVKRLKKPKNMICE